MIFRFAVTTLAFLVSLLTPAVADEVTTFTLKNGMQVIVVEDHRAPAVQQMVWYRAGSADEPVGASGVAHFLEHLLFKATDKLAEGEFSSVVAQNGGRDNAFTSFDYTAYFQRVASDRLELMMEMEADRMRNIRLTEENIRTERNVIIEERNQRTENNPGALFNEQMKASQYLNHRYGVPIIGWMHEMVTLDMNDVTGFYDTYYAPNNAILIVTGDVTPEEVQELAEKYYGVIPANPNLPERVRSQEPPQTAERRLIYRDARVAQPYVRRSYLAPARKSGNQEQAAALVFLSALLGGGQTSFLTNELQFDKKIANYAASFYQSLALDDTTFGLVIVPRPGVTLQEAEDALDAAVKKFMAEGVDPEHLERIKFQMKAEEIYRRDSVNAIGNLYGRALTTGLEVEDVKAWPEILQAVTAEDIMQGARDVFDRRSSVTGWITGEEVTQ